MCCSLQPYVLCPRPMDNVELSFDTPQEDEIAVNVLSAGTHMLKPSPTPNSNPNPTGTSPYIPNPNP